MVDTSFTPSTEKAMRHAQPVANDPLTGRPQSFTSRGTERFDCGGTCAVSTAADYLRFAQMLLNKGTLDSVRILGRKTVEYMTADHLGPEVNIDSLRAFPNLNGYGFGLGVAVRRGTGVAPIMGSSGDYHWPGGSGTYFWVDPKEELAVVFMSATLGEIRLRHRQLITTLTLQSIVN
jgi:CubicO group peptidase (beta-lactamase class C family)